MALVIIWNVTKQCDKIASQSYNSVVLYLFLVGGIPKLGIKQVINSLILHCPFFIVMAAHQEEAYGTLVEKLY